MWGAGHILSGTTGQELVANQHSGVKVWPKTCSAVIGPQPTQAQADGVQGGIKRCLRSDWQQGQPITVQTSLSN